MSRQPSIPPMVALSISVICFVLFLITMGLIFGGCASTRTGKVLNAGVVAAGTADYATTRIGIANGAREANSFMGQGALRQALLKGLGVSSIIFLTSEMEIHHPRLSHVIRSAAIVAWSAAAVSNSRVR